MLEITLNNEKNGIEIKFDSKPETAILTSLKDIGFRWSPKLKIWYAKKSEERMEYVKSLEYSSSPSIKGRAEECEKENKVYDLWKNTRTDEIENNFELYHIYDTKEIASIIRKHLKERFPFCKWSVRSSLNSIDLSLKSSPWEKENDEVKAIVHYAYIFAQSYNYNNSDSMTDYFDVNFYGVYEHSIVDYDYQKREETVAEYNISREFQKNKEAWEKEEQIRKEKEFEEYQAKREKEEAEYKKLYEENKVRHSIIEENAMIKEVDYFVLNLEDTGINKLDNLESYHNEEFREITEKLVNCKVSREVHLSPEHFEMFSKLLLDDWSFLEHMGGSYYDDKRINSMIDYEKMDKEERKTVEWYSCDCVAIFSGTELKIVVDPQGYNYARYVYFVTEESGIVKEHQFNSGIDDKTLTLNKRLADELEDVSTDIILNNNITDTWNNTDYPKYKDEIKKWIYKNNFPFSVGIVRALTDDNIKLKEVWYKILEEVNSIQEKFKRSGLKENQEITIIHFGNLGMLNVSHGKFKSFKCCSYAQYDDAVKLIYRPKNKRSDYYSYFYKEVLIFDGYVTFPTELLYEIKHGNGVITKHSLFLSFDKKQYDIILDYFNSKGIKPIINTYK